MREPILKAELRYGYDEIPEINSHLVDYVIESDGREIYIYRDETPLDYKQIQKNLSERNLKVLLTKIANIRKWSSQPEYLAGAQDMLLYLLGLKDYVIKRIKEAEEMEKSIRQT